MRKIASVTPLWNQQIFVGPHFDLLKKLDYNLVLLQNGVLPSYRDNHGYPLEPDNSESILRKYFPKVDIRKSTYDANNDFQCELYNEGLRELQDYDIVLRLDPDMLWTEEDFDAMIDYMRNTSFDCYRMDFSKDSINYYITWDYEHGLKDAGEFDALGVDPKKMFTGIVEYPEEKSVVMKFNPKWTCHHFRGWNKPKSTPKWWHIQPNAQEALTTYGDKGKWYVCPETIKKRIDGWKERSENT